MGSSPGARLAGDNYDERSLILIDALYSFPPGTNSDRWRSRRARAPPEKSNDPASQCTQSVQLKTAKSWYPSRNRVMRSRSVLAIMIHLLIFTSLGSRGFQAGRATWPLTTCTRAENPPDLLLNSGIGMPGELGLRRTVAYTSRLRPQPPAVRQRRLRQAGGPGRGDDPGGGVGAERIVFSISQ